MITKERIITPADGMVMIDYPERNHITFCADLPFKEENGVINVVTAVKNNDAYLTDMFGSADIKYPREDMEGNLRVVATVSFPNGIPEGYRAKINSFEVEDFTIEYHEEVIVKV